MIARLAERAMRLFEARAPYTELAGSWVPPVVELIPCAPGQVYDWKYDAPEFAR